MVNETEAVEVCATKKKQRWNESLVKIKIQESPESLHHQSRLPAR